MWQGQALTMYVRLTFERHAAWRWGFEGRQGGRPGEMGARPQPCRVLPRADALFGCVADLNLAGHSLHLAGQFEPFSCLCGRS